MGHGINISDRLLACPQVVAREVAGETVLLDLAGGGYFGLDEVGSRIWQWLATPGGCTPGEMAERLMRDYGIGRDRAEHDVVALARSLVEHGLAQAAETMPPTP